MAKTDPLDPNVPAGGEDPKLGDNRIRELVRAVAELLNIDHYMGSDGGSGVGYNEDAAGEHKRVKFKAPLASDPANAPNKAFLYTKDVAGKVELFWQDENGIVRQLTSGGKLHSDGGFSMLSGQVATIETIQAVDATGVVIKNDGGDTVITAQNDGKAQLANGSKLATSAAPGADAQLVNKKYVDDLIDAVFAALSFGTRTNKDSLNNTLVINEVYKVGSDGYVQAYDNTAQSNSTVTILTDGSNPPTTELVDNYNNATGRCWGMSLVLKDDYWKVTGTATAIYWVPIGVGSCVKQA